MDADKMILLVEDNKDDELLTLRAFKKNKIANRVVVARTGEEAVDFLFGTGAHAGEAGPAPTVILLDLNLPKMSGLEVLRKVRGAEKTRLVPVVVLTSSKEDGDIVTSYSLGANAYVGKPVDFGQFVEAVKTLGLFWLLLNEVPKQRS
jgi:CheY-like chemotaxis protein